MFITPPNVLDPFRFPGRLVVCVDTSGRQDCGVFVGQNSSFEGTPLKRGQRLPTVQVEEWSETGMECFEIVGLTSCKESHFKQYHFTMTSWESKVYCSYLSTRVFVLSNSSGDSWNLSFEDTNLTVVLDEAFGRSESPA